MATLGANRYGKSHVRLSRITRFDDRNEFNEWSVNVMLYGDFGASYTEADNSKVLPTDTMKNTVYVVARLSRATTIEDFARESEIIFSTTTCKSPKSALLWKKSRGCT